MAGSEVARTVESMFSRNKALAMTSGRTMPFGKSLFGSLSASEDGSERGSLMGQPVYSPMNRGLICS